MAFKDSLPQFQILELSRIDPDPQHVRQSISEEALKGLVNAIEKLGVIQPLIVRPGADGRYVVLAGERRRLAAIQAGETTVPVVIRTCTDDEALTVRVFENIGLGVRSALEPRDMANAIQAIAERFESPEAAAQYFGRAPTWLAQATAAANLSEKVSALLDSGKIASTGAAVQLEKLAKKNESRAETLIEQIEQLPEGEKASKKLVDAALQQETGRGKKEEAALEPVASAVVAAAPAAITAQPVAEGTPPWEEPAASKPQAIVAPATATATPRSRVSPGKVKLVAELLGLSEDDEEELLVRLIDEYLALKGA